MSYGDPNNPYGQQPPQQPNPYGQQAPQGVPPQGYGYPQQPGMPYGAHPQQPMGMPGVPPLASMGRRFAARLIDGVVISVVYGIVMGPKLVDLVRAMVDCDPDASDSVFNACVDHAQSDFYSGFWPLMLILWVVVALYETLMIGFVGATLGKLALGLRALKAETGEKPGIGGGFLRWVIPTVGTFACGIGTWVVYLSPLWDKSGRKQGWHDKVAGTVVVQVKG
ncbi:RDD family protein [Streptomyces sp. NPDC050095]|uniref:RDD family protein n=1 Tax=unclassified Streptomyces TaxID=2593676 RepID=UPI00343299D4